MKDFKDICPSGNYMTHHLSSDPYFQEAVKDWFTCTHCEGTGITDQGDPCRTCNGQGQYYGYEED